MFTALLLLTANLLQAPVDLETAVRRAQAGDTYDVLWVVGVERPGRFEAAHPELDLRAAFDADAVELTPANGAWRWSARLVALSRGGERIGVGAGELHVERDVIRNARAELDESFLHHRGGLEHAFEIAEAPGQLAGAPLELQLALDTDLVAQLDSDARGVEFRDECARAVLSYRGLTVWDAAGRELPARLCIDPGELRFVIDDDAAKYPILVDPLITTSETRLDPSPAVADGQAGNSVEIDGDTAAVWFRPNSGSSSVAVFERGTGGWAQVATLQVRADVIDIDGERMLISEWSDGWCGYARIFRRNAGVWSLEQNLPSPDCDFTCHPSAYGWSAALDNVRERLVVSDPHYLCIATSTAVYVYEYSTFFGQWRAVQRLSAPAGFGSNFGSGLALDGDDLLISTTSSVLRYRYDAAASEFAFLDIVYTGLTGVANDYGDEHPIALHDGIALIGDAEDDTLGNDAGAAHLVELVSGQWRWAFTAYPESSVLTNAHFGRALAFDGSVAALGDLFHDAAGSHAGAVQLYARNGGWTRIGTLVASDAAADDNFGAAVALDRDPAARIARLIAGAPLNDVAFSNTGAAYVFELAHADAQVYCTAKLNSANCIPRMGFSGSPSLSSAAPFTLSATNVINQRNGVFFYGTSGRVATVFQGGYRCAQSPTRRTGTLSSGGNPTGVDCSGVLAFDFNAWLQSGADPSLIAGAIVDGQFWYRDGAASFGTGLSEAIEFVVQP